MTNNVSIVLFLFISSLYAGLIAIMVINYVLTAKAMYKLSVRRSISCPWMAWIPVLNYWNIGLVANEYDSRLGMKRKWNLVLLILYGSFMLLFEIVFCVFYAILLVIILQNGEPNMIGLIIPFIVIYFLMFVMMFAAVALEFVYMILIFKIFESTVPEKAVKYLILSLLVPLASAICLNKCADKGYPFPETLPSDETQFITEQ